ncbi:glycoside hydrolase family 16 protein [Flavobacteriaceae bacterium F89]|uniref:Glycoside hydrolase family 16 protein n=1 Tax=Cerina litoralis TaxID=2874477 RepID=A0AAE3EYK3_9FLAO|nr:glycoside hydrolase family 16 protein [Cerina litoralis]MCG2461961.1 glycoside hydrolase family 16 protein [Cerina litoralis]
MRVLSILFLLIYLTPDPVTSQRIQSPVPTNPTGKDPSWELIWEDNFTKKKLDKTKWNVIERNSADWGNYMSDKKELIRIKDGMLYLRGIENKNRKKDTVPYLTGGINTKGKFSYQYGKIEIRAQLEQAQGAWPAMWMLADKPKYGAYPRNGEIDLMEHLNFEDKIYQTVHSYYTLKLKQDTIPPHYATAKADTREFNIYGMEWYPDKLVFTLNGEETFTYPRLSNVDPTQWPFDQPFYIMIDMQLGGQWVGKVDSNDLPVQMIIDWVKVYKERTGP